MVTIRDVAERAGVSATTVSHVINRSRPVSDDLTERVLAAMRELGFRPNALARSLRRKQTHTFGIIVPDSANPFFAEVARGIETASFASGYSVILCNSDGDADRELLYLDLLTQKQVDGIFLVASGDASEHTARLQDRTIPIVLIDRELPAPNIDCVVIDNVEGSRLATQHLVDLGHRRIACITRLGASSPGAERLAGYQRALADAGIEYNERFVLDGSFHDRDGYLAAQALLAQDEPPTAIFAANDLMAMGAIAAACQANIVVPHQLSVVGFDNIHLAEFFNPPLTTVAQPKHELGVIAAQMLFARLENSAMPPQRQLLSTELIVRGSTAPHPERARAAQPAS